MRPKEPDTVDSHDHTALIATQEPVVTAAPPDLGLAALDNASILARESLTLRPSLERVIARQKLYARVVDDNALMATGPVQAILLDPLLTNLTGDLRVARVK
jgi:hypothetical protein